MSKEQISNKTKQFFEVCFDEKLIKETSNNVNKYDYLNQKDFFTKVKTSFYERLSKLINDNITKLFVEKSGEEKLYDEVKNELETRRIFEKVEQARNQQMQLMKTHLSIFGQKTSIK